MDDLQAEEVLRQLREQDATEGWTRFLERYSPLLFDVVRRFEREEDDAIDCYLFICQQLSANGFRTLLRFRTGGPARFSTWLCAVARNLCLDWHRREFGRHRVFESVARMPTLDQEVFHRLFVARMPLEDLWLDLHLADPGLTLERLAQRAEAVERALTPRQRWLLAVRLARGAPTDHGHLDEAGDAMARIPAEQPSPEAWTRVREERALLLGAISRLPARDRLLIRLRFGRGLTLAAIAQLLGLDGPQSADRHIRAATEKLRADITRGREGP